MDEFRWLEIRIGPRPRGAEFYPVEARLDDGSHFAGGELRLDLQKLSSGARTVEAYGLDLFDALCAGPIRRAFDRASGRAEAETAGRLRIRLWIDASAVELHAVPWERLFYLQRGQPTALAASTFTPFSRYVGLELPEAIPVRERPIRLLFAIANPAGLPANLPAIDPVREAEALRQTLGNLQQAGQLHVTFLPGRTGLPAPARAQLEEAGFQVDPGPTTLDAILRRLPDVHILHFAGHGSFRRGPHPGAGVTFLFLENENGDLQRVADSDLTPRLAALDPLPRLIFLAACDTARIEPQSPTPFVGLGPQLVQAGVPAVIAMQDPVPDDLARRLTAEFYHHLAEHGVVDLALNQARQVVFDPARTEWATPVLLLRQAQSDQHQGQLFAPDPVRLALQAILDDQPRRVWSEDEYLPIPIEVVHLLADQIPADLAMLEAETVPTLDLVDAALAIFARREATTRAGRPQRGKLAALVGGHGTAKSTQMRRLVWLTARRSLEPGETRRILPIYVDLGDYPSVRSSLRNPIEALVLQNLQAYWPATDAAAADDLRRVLRSSSDPILRVFVDGGDDLPDRLRLQAWRAVQAMARDYPQHEFMIAVDRALFDPRQLNAVTDLLLIQPISQRKIEQFLLGLDEEAGPQLYQAIVDNQLFDLASIPWLLRRMLDYTRQGTAPRSRVELLQGLAEDAIAVVPAELGMRARADATLQALAWEMQIARVGVLPIDEAIRIAATARGNREYSLEALISELIECGLLARTGQEQVRFAYPVIQAYFCARALLQRPDRDQFLEEITASLGRLSRVRWWESVLVLLSGLMRSPNVLLRMLLYGESLAEGESLFLAVRCVLEAGVTRIEASLLDQIVDALIWQLDAANLRSPARRVRAIDALGQLRLPAAIPYLAAVANQRLGNNWRGQPAFELSNVRMAAAVALQRMMSQFADEIAAADPQMAILLRLWQDGAIDRLIDWLHREDTGAQAIAAFALAHLYTPQRPEIMEALIAAFQNPDVSAETRWAMAEALTLLDPAIVLERAILPFLDRESSQRAGLSARAWRYRSAWYERLAYLAGVMRLNDPRVRAFLDRCLREFTDIEIKARAIQSLGWMFDQSYKELFEEIAIGDFTHIAVSARLRPQDALYLRGKAIAALGAIGDQTTIERLREHRVDWDPELRRASYWASEEITWRLGRGGTK